MKIKVKEKTSKVKVTFTLEEILQIFHGIGNTSSTARQSIGMTEAQSEAVAGFYHDLSYELREAELIP